MRKTLVGSVAALLTSAGVALAQGGLPPAPVPVMPPGPGPLSAPPPPQFAPIETITSPGTTSLWFNADYLIWWIKDSPVPTPLLTSGSLFDFNPGALGQPGTRVLLGGDDVENKLRNGGRFTVGYWFDCNQTCGIEAGYFFLGKRTITQVAAADEPTAVGGVPFFDEAGLFTPTGLPGESFSPLGGLGLFTDRAMLPISSRFQGAELNGLLHLAPGGPARLAMVGGFRYLQLDEELQFINDFSTLLVPGVGVRFLDQFETRNRFFGGQAGFRYEFCTGKVFFHAVGKVAVGYMRQSAEVIGQTTLTILGSPIVSAGGIFAQPSNSGHFQQDRLAAIPEVTLTLGYQFTPNFRVFGGYNFLYVSNVLRPGDQIDHHLNLTQSPFFGSGALSGSARPAVLLEGSDFWAQGFSLGIGVSF